MNLSKRCGYGYFAVLELAGHCHSGEPLRIESIATRRRIPEKFLVHVLLQLKRAGIVRSIRGAKGGYLLGRPPESISLLDIIEAIEGPVLGSSSVGPGGSRYPDAAWPDVAREIEEVLSRTTIRNALDKAAEAEMYYI